MKKKTSRRIAASSAYIGAGNKTSSFSQRPAKAFGRIPEAYKKTRRRKAKPLVGEKLSEEEIQKLSRRLRAERKTRHLKILLAFGLTLFLLALLTVGILTFVF